MFGKHVLSWIQLQGLSLLLPWEMGPQMAWINGQPFHFVKACCIVKSLARVASDLVSGLV